MTFKEISEKYPKGFGEYINTYGKPNDIMSGLYLTYDIRKFYSDIVDFFDGKGIHFSIDYVPFNKCYDSDIYSVYNLKYLFTHETNSRSESETAGLEMLFKIYEERIGK